eukprot:g4688.t1
MEFDACYRILQERAAKGPEHRKEVEKVMGVRPGGAVVDLPEVQIRDDAPEDVTGKAEDPAIEAAIAKINRDFPDKVSLQAGGGPGNTAGTTTATFGFSGGLDDIVSDIRTEAESQTAASTFARPDDCQQVRDAMAAIEDERWESAATFYSLPAHKKLLALEKRRVKVQKSFDLVLKRLIARREVDAGYARLAKSVTSAFQEVNLKTRELGKELDETLSAGGSSCVGGGSSGHGATIGFGAGSKDEEHKYDVDMGDDASSEEARSRKRRAEQEAGGAAMILGTPAYEANRELKKSVEKILKLQKSKFEQVVAFHAAQIRLYTETMRGSLQQTTEDERARRMFYQEVANLKNVIQQFENDIEEELTEVRYGY